MDSSKFSHDFIVLSEVVICPPRRRITMRPNLIEVFSDLMLDVSSNPP